MARSERISRQSGGRTSTGDYKAVLLAAALVLTAGAFVILSDAQESDAGDIGPNLSWELKGNTLIIKGTGDMREFGQLLPYAWYTSQYYEYVEHIVLNEGITSLAKGCFKFPNLTGEIVLPKSLKVIAPSVFEGTGITSIVIPEGSQLTTIDRWAFKDCKELTGNIWLPKSMTYIGTEAFKDCTKLTGNIVIPASMNYIGTGIFDGCKNLSCELKVQPDVLYIAHRAFQGCTGITGKIEMTNQYGLGVWGSAFKGCKGLTEFTALHCISSIGESAFEGCTGLKVVRVNDGRLEDRAFAGCTGLTEVDIGSKINGIKPTAFEGIQFFDEDGNELVINNDNLSEFVGYIFEGSDGKLTRSGPTAEIIPDLPDEGDGGINMMYVGLPAAFIAGLIVGLLVTRIRRP